MPKRASTGGSPAQRTPKKAKPEQTQSPEALLLAALAKAEHVPKSCLEMLQTALPHALATPCADRHKFQLQVLDGISSVLSQIEDDKRTARGAAMAHLASIETEKDTAASDVESKRALATAKKAASKEKQELYEEASKAAQVASGAVKDAQQTLVDAEAKKKQLLADQEEFQQLVSGTFQPLKIGNFPGHEWRKRNKMAAEFLKVLESKMTVEPSMLDALDVVFKTKPDQREPFADVTLEYAEKAFDSHTQQLSQDSSRLDEELVAQKTAIEASEGVLAEKTSQKNEAEKVWETMENEWVDLENAAFEAAQVLKDLEQAVLEAREAVDTANDALEKFLEVPATFSKLKEPVPEEVPAEQVDAAAEKVTDMERTPIAAEQQEAVS